jgi:DNA repair protein RadC
LFIINAMDRDKSTSNGLWARLFGKPQDARPASRPRRSGAYGPGFAEAEPAAFSDMGATRKPRGPAAATDIDETQDLPFPSTGPRGHRSRMRARLLQRGADSLADYEMLEMLLFFAQPKGDTKPLAKALINQHGSFANVLFVPAQKLLETPGLGEHSVAALKLVQASALRLARAEVMDRPVVNNHERLMDYLSAVLSREPIEQFRVLFLDSRNRLIADEAQARGSVNHTPVYPREVIKRALELHATALILVHNHPSGDPTPSRQDLEMTAEIEDAGAIMSIRVHDHFIIGQGKQYSFKANGHLARS